MRNDPLRLATHVFVYAVLYFATVWLFGGLFLWLGGYLLGVTAAGLVAAIFANWLAMRIYEGKGLVETGLQWGRASSENLALGVIGGVGCALLVLVTPIATGFAHLTRAPGEVFSASTLVFVIVLLAAGAVGEELLFRGYGFQILLAAVTPWAVIPLTGGLFAWLHSANPSSSPLGLANTAGFGVLFGYAYWRSRDLWLPIGLHFGWNVTLPLFGVNLSGLKINVTAHQMTWTAGELWSGGEYGPEASLLTTAVLLLLFLYLYKVPVRRQPSALTDPQLERNVCEPSPILPS